MSCTHIENKKISYSFEDLNFTFAEMVDTQLNLIMEHSEIDITLWVKCPKCKEEGLVDVVVI